MEVFAYAGDEADAGVEAGDDEDNGQKHLSHPAKQAVGQCRQDGGAGVAAGERGPRDAADVGQHGVDHQQHPACDEPGPDGAAPDGSFFRDAHRLNVQRDDCAEVERC